MVNPGEKLKKILLITGITGAVYGGFKYLLPLVVPFLFAYGAALWLGPSVRYFERRMHVKLFGREFHVPAAVIGGVELVVLTALVSGVLYFGGIRLVSQLERFMAGFPQWLTRLDAKLTELCKNMEVTLGLREEYLVVLVRDMVKKLTETMKQSTMPLLMNNSMTVLKWAAETVVFLIIFFVATLMFLQEMDEIREKKSRSMFHREFSLLGRRLAAVCSAWLKTQAVIMSVTSVVCILGLWIIGNSYAFLVGLGIGILDALPIFGTGTVLIPWGILCLAQGKLKEGIVLLGLYVVCYFVRQILEAKIMGGQVGLSSLETLISMYVGLKLFGIAGFLLGPIGLLMIEDLLDLYWRESR